MQSEMSPQASIIKGLGKGFTVLKTKLTSNLEYKLMLGNVL